jgi:phosphopantothenoylcysteine decarboxylase/phosphopantothenate--cysteine ligase
VEFEPTPKIIDQAKDWAPRTFLTAFRAVCNLSQDDLVRDGTERLKKARADMIVVNDTGQPGRGFESDTNEVTVITADMKAVTLPQEKKSGLASKILDIMHEKLSHQK